MPNLPELYIMQWAILGIYVVLYFFIGIKRGTEKSLFYTLVNLITTAVVIIFISHLSIKFILNFVDEQDLYGTINGWTNGALTPYMDYLANSAVTNTIYIFVDLVFRIVAFFLFYPVLKRLLSVIIFHPIWNHGIKKAIIKRQNEKGMEKAKSQNKTFKPRKKIKSSAVSRLGGGLIGMVEGLIVAFIILIPITVTSSFIAQIDTEALTNLNQDTAEVATIPTNIGDLVPSEVIDYINQVKEMDEKGVTSITREITVGGVPIDRYIFDEMFTVQTEVNDEASEVNFFNELENIFGIASVLINGGYLNPNFDYTQISSDNLDDIDQILGYIGESDLLGYMIPTAARYGVEYLLFDEIGINFSDRESAAAALEMFYNIDWTSEFDHLYALVASVLEFGSIQEIIELVNDPTAIANLTPEQGVALANIIRNVGDLELLSLINVGVDYMTTLDNLQSQIGWLDTAQEKEAYLQDHLSYILDDPDFFIGEEGEIADIADLIELFFTDEYGDTNLDQIIEAKGDINTILTLQNEDWIAAVTTQLTKLDILMNSLPMGVDFALYKVGGDTIDEALAEELRTAMDEVDWNQEFENFDNIYQSVLKLGLERVLNDNPDYYAYIDILVENNMDDVRDIVSYIFEDSQIVGSALELIAPEIIDRFVTDTELKEIIQSIALDEQDEFDFNVGGEIINVLNIAESAYGFVDAQALQRFSTMSQEEQLQIIADFGAMDETKYTAFLKAFDDLQLLNRMDETVATQIVNKFDLSDKVYLPSEFTLNDDVTALLDMIHDIGIYLGDNLTIGAELQDLDLTDLLDVLSTDLLDKDERSDLLFYNIAFYAKKYAGDDSMSSYVSIPDSLLNADIESQVWEDEISALFGSIFDIATAIGETEGITLSIHDITLYSKEAYRLPVELITQFSDPLVAQRAFDSLDDSLILRSSIKQMIDTQGEGLSDTLFGHVVKTPDHLVTDGVLNEGVFVNLINGFATFVDGMNDTLAYEKFGEFSFDDLTPLFNAYNQMDQNDVHAFVESDLLKGVISDILLDEDFVAELAAKVNEAQEILEFSSDFFAVDPILIDGSVLADGEITNIFTMFQALEFEGTDGFSNIGLATFTDLVVADPETGEDNFDEFFASDYIYTILDKVLRLDGISDYVGTTLGDSLGTDFTTLDLTIPDPMLGQTADVGSSITAIEEDRIPKAEFRRVLTSIGTLGNLGEIGLNTFTDMIDPLVTEDDFSTFIASDFIYLVLSRLIGNEGFSGYAEEMLSGAFGDDPVTLNMAVPDDAKGTAGIETGLISRVELRNLMISFEMLGIGGEASVDVANIIALPSETDIAAFDTDPSTNDNLDVFLKSTYLADKMSQMLLSPTIIDLIGANQFDSSDFELPENAFDDNVSARLATVQIHKLFYSLVILDISDFDSMDLDINSVVSLSSEHQEELLSALYLYTVIDLMVKAQAVDPEVPGDVGLSIPSDAYASGGYYDGMITQKEILTVLSVFKIDGISPEGLDPNTIEVSVLAEVVNKDSKIINQTISDQVGNQLDISYDVIPEAYEDPLVANRLMKGELLAMIATLTEILVDEYNPEAEPPTLGSISGIGAISTDSIRTVNEYGLDLPVDPEDDQYQSYLVQYILTDSIVTGLGDLITIPDTIYVSEVGISEDTYITPEEIDNLANSLDHILGDGQDLSDIGSLDYNTLKIGALKSAVGQGSIIVHQIVSDQVKAVALLNISYAAVPEAFEVDQATLKIDDILAVLSVVGVIGSDDGTVEPDDVLLGGLTSTGAISTNSIRTINEYGLDLPAVPEDDQYQSYLVQYILTDSIVTGLGDLITIPDTIYVSEVGISEDTYITPEEIDNLANSLDHILGDGQDLSDIGSLDYNTLKIGALKSAVGQGSIIVHQIVSDQVKAVALLNISYAAVPEAFEVDQATLKIDDILAVLSVVGVIGSDDGTVEPDDVLLGGLTSTGAISTNSIRTINEYGLDLPAVPEDDQYQSYLVQYVLTNSIENGIGALITIPESVYISEVGVSADTYITPEEIDNLANSLDDILSEGQNLSDIGSLNYQDIKVSDFKSAVGRDSEIINLIVSNQMTGILTIAYADVPEAYIADNSRLTTEDMQAVLTMMDDLSNGGTLGGYGSTDTITTQDLSTFNAYGLATPVDDEYQSYLVQYLLTESIEKGIGALITIPSTTYIQDVGITANTYLIADEVDSLVAGLDFILPPGGDISNMSGISNDKFGYQMIRDLIGVDSLIMYRMISNSIISSNIHTLESDVENVGDRNYDPSAPAYTDIKITEMNYIADAMEALGVTNITTMLDDINESRIMNLSNPAQIIGNNEQTENTIVYYIIENILHSAIVSTPFFDEETFVDEAGVTRITRASTVAYIEYINSL